MRRTFPHLVPTLLALACARQTAAPGPSLETDQTAGAGDRATITVVGTNDLHGHLESLAWLSGHLRNLRALRAKEGGAVLVLDAGDMLQGTLESNLGEGTAVIRAYNAMGYAAAAIGNHEFDFGPEGAAPVPSTPDHDPRGALRARAAEARFPLLAANLREVATSRAPPWPNVHASVLVEAAGVKIGLVGITTLRTPRATHPRNFAGLEVTPLEEAAAAEAHALRAQGAAAVVVLAHAGGRCTRFDNPDDLSSCDQGEEIFRFARALPPGLVDVIVAGHTHQAVAHRVAGIAVIESYANGRAFGRVDLIVNRARRRVEATHLHPPRSICGGQDAAASDPPSSFAPDACRPDPYAGGPVVFDQRLAALLAPDVERARARREAPVGVFLASDLRRSHAAESPLGNLVVDLMRAARPGADVAFTNGGGLRADLPAGALTYGQLYRALPFDNSFATLRMTADDLARVLARNLGGSAGILSVAGVRAAARCEGNALKVKLESERGAALAPETALTVVTNDFLASGGDGLLEGLPVEIEEGPPVREAVAAALKSRGGTLRADDPALFDRARPRLVYPGSRPVRCAATPATAPNDANTAAPAPADACQRRLEALRRELKRVSVDFLGYARPESAFSIGQQNPKARAALVPHVERLLKQKRPRMPEYALECKTWACRLAVREMPWDNANDWRQPMQSDPKLKALTHGLGFLSHIPGKDSATDTSFHEFPVYIKLGERLSGLGLEPSSETVGCAPAAAAFAGQIPAMRAIVEKDQPRHLRFFDSVPSPELTAEITREVRRVLGQGSGAPAVTVECRGSLCRVLPPANKPEDYSWRAKLESDPDFTRRVQGGSCCVAGRFYEIAPAGQVHGRAFLKNLVDEMDRSLDLLRCYRIHPATGVLEARFFLPPTGEVNDDKQRSKISVRYGGGLADTPIGKCVARAVAKNLLSRPVPESVSGAVVFKDFKFPR
jgi:2',3'-cyclic-nucleotide 2'-phosphodiesterase (5'-nucleotidase family)